MRSGRFQKVLDYSVYLLVRLFVCITQALPIETCAVLARRLATVCCDWLRIRGDVIEDNLRHAFPEMTAVERRNLCWRMWEHLFLMLIEVVHAPRKIHDTNWRDYISVSNVAPMLRAFFDDRPTVLICGHYGNFELSGFALGMLGFPSYTIARPLDNRYLDRFLNEFRGLNGQFILPKIGSSQQVEQVLERGGILALLGDQYAGPKGCWTEFFGRPASSHKAIALFSLSSGAPAIFCYARRTGRPLHQVLAFGDILDPRIMPADMRTVPAITQWYTRHLERTIRQAPEQYWWLHRRWREGPAQKPSLQHSQAA